MIGNFIRDSREPGQRICELALRGVGEIAESKMENGLSGAGANRMKRAQTANILLEKHMTELGLDFERECRFCAARRWRADYRIKSVLLNGQMVLIEIDGAVYTQGRHNRGKGFENDMRKINKAQSMGYYVLRFSTNMVNRGEARAFLAELFGRQAK